MEVNMIEIEKWYLMASELAKSGEVIKAEFTVAGGSMYPTIRKGVDTVTLVPVTGRLKKYDIILFRAKRPTGDYCLHRINKVKTDERGKAFRTRGDNCRKNDNYIGENDVIGKAVSVQKNGKAIRLDSIPSKIKFIAFNPVRKIFNNIVKKITH